MKKRASFFLKITLLMLFLPRSAYSGASGQANMSMVTNVVGAGVAAVYTKQKAAQCGTFNKSACWQAGLGALQTLSFIMGAMNSMNTRDALLNGDFTGVTFEPKDSGFCFNGNGCSPTSLDRTLVDFDDPFKTGKGVDLALQKLKTKLDKSKAQLAQKGYSIDEGTGVITGPDGKKVKSSKLGNPALGSSLSKTYSQRVAGVKKALEAKGKRGTSKRAIASAAGSGLGGGVIFKDEFIDGSGASKIQKKREDVDGLLAGLSDKNIPSGSVGFAGDDIFKMLQRRYKKKNSAQEFIVQD